MTILKQRIMGGNGASKNGCTIPLAKCTHADTNFRIQGHKVLVQANNPVQMNTPVNSNSENPYCLCASIDKDTRIITIKTNGNFIPYAAKGKGTSHSHKWPEDENGDIGRKSKDPQNHLSIDSKYQELINEVVKFNKLKKTWRK